MTKRTCAVLVLAALLGTADAQEGPPPRVAELVAKLSEDGAAGAAAEELAKIGAPAVPALAAALGDAKARAGAIDALARIGPAAKDAVPALTALGQDPANAQRLDAIRALGAIGGSAAGAYPALAKLCADAESIVQIEAAIAIRRIASRAAAAPADAKPRKPTDVEAAVQEGLGWLARHQEPDGRWSGAKFEERCAKQGDCAGAGSAAFDAGLTGLAVLAFLSAGETQHEGPHAETVRSALDYLRTSQTADGGVGSRASMQFIYNHAIGGLAVADAYARTGSPALADPSRRAVAFTLGARNSDKAWGYMPGMNDTSVTVWNARLLDAAAASGIDVQPDALEGGVAWVDDMTDPKTGRTGYQLKGGPPGRTMIAMSSHPAALSESMTAAALLTRLAAGQTREKEPLVAKAEALLVARPPVWDGAGGATDLYYWMLGADALHRLGGAGWDAWRKALPNALVANQVTTPGCGKGSWRPADAWGAEGGRIWMTSACVQALAQCVDDPAKRPQMPADLRACVTALEKAAREQKPSVRAAASRAVETVRRAYR